ncbi:MAG: hypothetical protein AAF986_10075 [Pseudomonadota bacterium]
MAAINLQPFIEGAEAEEIKQCVMALPTVTPEGAPEPAQAWIDVIANDAVPMSHRLSALAHYLQRFALDRPIKELYHPSFKALPKLPRLVLGYHCEGISSSSWWSQGAEDYTIEFPKVYSLDITVICEREQHHDLWEIDQQTLDLFIHEQFGEGPEYGWLHPWRKPENEDWARRRVEPVIDRCYINGRPKWMIDILHATWPNDTFSCREVVYYPEHGLTELIIFRKHSRSANN